MRVRRIALVVVVAAVAAAMAAPALARAGRSADEDQVAAAIVEYLNAERAARGLAPLSWVSDSYAQDRADEQPNGGTDGHAGFSASAAANAMGLEGARTTAETLYWGGVVGAGGAVRNWMQSSAHRDVLMHPQMTHLSVGVSCRTDSLHAVAHVGVEDTITVSRTPADPVVTSSSRPRCGEAAPPAEPEPEPEPEPAPPPAPEPPAPDPEPEPAATEEVAARPAAPEPRAMFHLGNVVFVEQPPPTPPPRPRPVRERVLAAPVPDLPDPVGRPLAPVVVGIGLIALQGLALALRPWRWRPTS